MLGSFFAFSVFCEKSTFKVGLFPLFLRAQKLNQHPAVMYDMGNRDFIIRSSKQMLLWISVSLWTQYSQQSTSVKNAASIWGVLACLPHIIRQKLQK